MTNDKIRKIITLLARADHFNKLAKACPPGHSRSFYKLKGKALDQALREEPGQFLVDSVVSGRRPLFGLTHRASGRRVHVRAKDLSIKAQALLCRLAETAGMTCTVGASSPRCHIASQGSQ